MQLNQLDRLAPVACRNASPPVKPKNRPGPARPGHVKIALDITAVEFDQFSLYSTGTMIMYDRLSL